MDLHEALEKLRMFYAIALRDGKGELRWSFSSSEIVFLAEYFEQLMENEGANFET